MSYGDESYWERHNASTCPFDYQSDDDCIMAFDFLEDYDLDEDYYDYGEDPFFDFDICEECREHGGDYYFGENGEYEHSCLECRFNTMGHGDD